MNPKGLHGPYENVDSVVLFVIGLIIILIIWVMTQI